MCLENTLLWAIVPGSYSPAEPSWHTSTSPCCPAVEQTPQWTLGTGTLLPYAAAEQQVNSEDHLPGETWKHNKVTDRSASTWTRTVSSIYPCSRSPLFELWCQCSCYLLLQNHLVTLPPVENQKLKKPKERHVSVWLTKISFRHAPNCECNQQTINKCY